MAVGVLGGSYMIEEHLRSIPIALSNTTFGSCSCDDIFNNFNWSKIKDNNYLDC